MTVSFSSSIISRARYGGTPLARTPSAEPTEAGKTMRPFAATLTSKVCVGTFTKLPADQLRIICHITTIGNRKPVSQF